MTLKPLWHDQNIIHNRQTTISSPILIVNISNLSQSIIKADSKNPPARRMNAGAAPPSAKARGELPSHLTSGVAVRV